MTEPSNLRSSQADEDEAAPARTFIVEVTRGKECGLRILLDPRARAVLVGHEPACGIRLADPEVSPRHASLEATDRGIRVIDLASASGTFVNGVAVDAATLRGGETIGLGQTLLRVEPTGTTALRPTSAAGFGALIGQSPKMRRLYSLSERLAGSDVPVVIEGETGTGKEVLAEAIHRASARAHGPFIVYDCTAVPSNLVESALFGHEKGAFTGATSPRKGVFEQAHGGTLFIDEIGELDLSLQPKLLRAIQRKEVQRVGGDGWVRVDVRVIAATRRDLDREVLAGRFRDDLFFRLAVGRVELPPLRQREGDVTLLARHFIRELGGDERMLPEGTLARLEEYGWPGNVRELENKIARLIALGDLDNAPVLDTREDDGTTTGSRGAIEASAWNETDSVGRILAQDLPFTRARQLVMEDFERRYVQRVLSLSGGNVSRAARASGLARRYFQMIRAKRMP